MNTTLGLPFIFSTQSIDEHGRQLNVEVRISMPSGMAQRLTYYTSRAYVEQLKEGQNYHELRPSIFRSRLKRRRAQVRRSVGRGFFVTLMH
jgi:predicted transposase/invertase (TIGR01784 family)